MAALVGRTAALHAAFWQHDPWYRRAWLVWPQALAALLAGWLIIGPLPQFVGGNWGKSANCAVGSNPDCAATNRALPDFANEIVSPSIVGRDMLVTVDQSAFAGSAAADQPRLTAALAAFYRSEWQQGIDALKAANANDRNVQFMLALLDLGGNTYDGVRAAQWLLQSAADAGQRQAAVVLGRTLMGLGGLPKDVPQARRLIETGAAAGDSYAMRLAAVGYLSGEFGSRDPAKAFDFMRRAADAGDPVAMTHLAWFYYSGLGGAARDEAKAVDYLHRAAAGGFTYAQFMIAEWAWNRYINGEPSDPSEVFKWYQRAYERGHSVTALGYLAVSYWLVHAPWTDTSRSFALLHLCVHFAYGYCHYWFGEAYYSGSGIPVDLVKAYAAFTVASQLGFAAASKRISALDGSMLPAAKAAGTELARTIAAGLKPMPPLIPLQTAEANAGDATWTLSHPQADAVSVQPSPKPAATDTTDWPACKNENGDPDAGIAACRRVIGSGVTGTDLGWAHFFEGWYFEREGKYEQAISHFDEAIRLQANVLWAKNNRVAELMGLNKLDIALHDINDVIAADPSFAMAYANRGEILRRQRQPDRAIADATEALHLDPKLRYAYTVRARAYEDKGQWTEVVADCTSALELEANDSDCLRRRGNAYGRMGKSAAALADFNESLRLEPRSPWTLVRRGNLRKDTGQLDPAIRDYTEAISQDPNNEDAFAFRADAFFMARQFDRAVADATKAIEIDPEWALGYIVRGRAYTELGRPEEGARDLGRAVLMDPKNALAHYFDSIAEAKLEEKRYATCPQDNGRRSNVPDGCLAGIQYTTAIAELNRAIELYPDYAEAYAYRGALYLLLRQRDKGIADARRALAIDPKNEFASRLLRSIHVSP
jgi:tetratricopeptide (TPR) repeat protein